MDQLFVNKPFGPLISPQLSVISDQPSQVSESSRSTYDQSSINSVKLSESPAAVIDNTWNDSLDNEAQHRLGK